MIAAEIIFPSIVLRPFVHHYWVMKTSNICMSQVIMPIGGLRWMFHRKRPFDVDGVTDFSLKASVVGLYDKAKHINTSEEIEMISVFFQPYAAKAIMNIPCQEFVNECVDFEQLGSVEFKTLKARILEADTTGECIGMIEDFIIKQLVKSQGLSYLEPLKNVFKLIDTYPEARLEELASVACLSERQFRRVFIDNVGLKPKQIQRIKRFHQAINEILLTNPDNLDTILCKYGYTDHSHFNREFHEIAGMSPTEYLALIKDLRKQEAMPAYRSFHTY